MINFSDFNLTSLFKEVDGIFDKFNEEEMPCECYGWRSWMIEKTFAKHSNGKLIKLKNKNGRDFLSLEKDGLSYEFKQVKDAFKNNITPSIVLKNFRGRCMGKSKKTFDYLIVMDVDRKILGMFDWEYVDTVSKVNDATITAQLSKEYAVQIETISNGLSDLLGD